MKLETTEIHQNIFASFYDDYTKYGITEEDISKIRKVVVCHPNLINSSRFVKFVIEEVSNIDDILFITNSYIEDEKSVILINEEALKRAFIINYLISKKKENNNEEN